MCLKVRLLQRAVAVVAACLISSCSAPIQEREILGVSAVSSSGNYKLVPNDLVRIDVFQETDMQTEQRIAQDGTVNVALVGRLDIGGLTVESASKLISDKLRAGFLVNPQVTVSVIEYSPRRFSVLGQVTKPGAYEIPGEEILTLPTAVAMAGGNTPTANLRQVTVTRNRDGKVYDIKVNLQSPQGRQFIVGKADMIMVPESLF